MVHFPAADPLPFGGLRASVALRTGAVPWQCAPQGRAVCGCALPIVAATAAAVPEAGRWLRVLCGVLVGAGLFPYMPKAPLTVRPVPGSPPVLVGNLLIVAIGGPPSSNRESGASGGAA